MKIFQIADDVCYWEASVKYNTLAETEGKYPPDILFVEAPDFVFEGWGYLAGEFIKPTPPAGWLYDDKTGGFYLETSPAPSSIPNPDEDRDAMLVDIEYRLTLVELGVTDNAV